MLSLLSLLPILAGAPQAAPATQEDWMVLGEVQVLGQTDPDGRKRTCKDDSTQVSQDREFLGFRRARF